MHWHSRALPGFMLHGCKYPFTRGGAFLFASPREGRGGLGRDSHEKGSEFVATLLLFLQLRILGLSDDRVQIACPLLLRRARSIRSLPQDAIGRSIVDALRKFTGYLTVPYSPIQRRASRYDVCRTTGKYPMRHKLSLVKKNLYIVNSNRG